MGTYLEYENESVARGHSGLGIASFVLSLFGGFLFFASIGAAIYLVASYGDELDEDSVQLVLLGLGLLGGALADLIAMGLGFAALFQTECRKWPAILGIVFGFAFLALTGGLLILGNLA